MGRARKETSTVMCMYMSVHGHTHKGSGALHSIIFKTTMCQITLQMEFISVLLFSQQSGYHGCRQSEKDGVLVQALEIKYIEQPDEATLIILLPRGSHPDY